MRKVCLWKTAPREYRCPGLYSVWVDRPLTKCVPDTFYGRCGRLLLNWWVVTAGPEAAVQHARAAVREPRIRRTAMPRETRADEWADEWAGRALSAGL